MSRFTQKKKENKNKIISKQEQVQWNWLRYVTVSKGGGNGVGRLKKK